MVECLLDSQATGVRFPYRLPNHEVSMYQGLVIRQKVASGSKSEREAFVLSTSEGDFILRMKGQPAFGDKTFEGVVNQNIEAEGIVKGTTLIVSSWKLNE